MGALETAATGMIAQQLNVSVVANNLANMNTTGFKRMRPEFQDLLYQDLVRVGSTSSDSDTVVPAGIQLGTGVKLASVYRVTTQGSLTSTGNQFDLAIQGKGYFRITLPSGDSAYTRTGSFQLSADGELVTKDGFTVEPGLNIPNNAVGVTINASGEVLATIDGQPQPTNVGQLVMVNFPNEAGLDALGDNLLQETVASGAAIEGVPATAGFGTVLQGYVETSNVNAVEEITTLIAAQRAYEMLARVIETSDEMLSTASQLT